MRKSRLTEEQMVTMLRVADRTSISEVAKKHGASEQTMYVWKKRFGSMSVEAKRLKQGSAPAAYARPHDGLGSGSLEGIRASAVLSA